MMFSQKPKSDRIFKHQAKALNRLRICAGWSEALLVAHTTLLEISYRGSFYSFAMCVTAKRSIVAQLVDHSTQKDLSRHY